jgi:hypothetical protein
VACLFVACKPYDASLLPSPDQGGAGAGAGGMDGSVAGQGGGDGGGQDGGVDACAADAGDMCNRADDDCDGTTDEGAGLLCAATVIHAETECVPFANTARCVLLRCLDGYDNCDGNPANGCEPFCACNVCDDAGTEDGGE